MDEFKRVIESSTCIKQHKSERNHLCEMKAAQQTKESRNPLDQQTSRNPSDEEITRLLQSPISGEGCSNNDVTKEG
jgi:hypothetical protein